MKLPELKGSPKQVTWAMRIRTDRLRVWRETSPERLEEIAEIAAAVTDAGWWISYREKEFATVCNHLSEGIDLQKIQRDRWRKEEKKQEQNDRAAAMRYLRTEAAQEAERGQGPGTVTSGRADEGRLLKREGPARDIRTGEISRDPDVPF